LHLHDNIVIAECEIYKCFFRSRIPSPGGRRNLVSATTSSADESWKDGCF